MSKSVQKKWNNRRKQVPTILQMEALECGAAALAMIFAYHGKRVPLAELRRECGVSRDGSKASNMLRTARKYGMEAKGFRMSPEGLQELALPMIVFWNFNHFVVLEGIKKNRVFLNDPADGRKMISYEEFDQSFTGIALTFHPGPDFEKGGVKRGVLHSLASRIKGCLTPLGYIVLAGLCLVIPGLVIPAFTKIFVDNILVGRMEGWLKPLLLAMGLTAVMRGLLTWLQQHYLLRFETKLALTGSAKFFRRVMRLPMDFFTQRSEGDISQRVQLNDKVAQLLSGELATNTLNVVLIVFYALVMMYYDLLLTVFGIITAILNLLVLKYVSTRRVTLNRKLQQENGKLLGLSMTGLQMIETLKASGAESDFFSQWSGQQAKVVNVQQELALPTQIMSVIPTFLMALNTTAILCVGGFRVMNGHMSMGMLVAFQSLMASFMTPVNQMVNLGSRLQEAEADMDRLDDVLEHRQDNRFSHKTMKKSNPEETRVRLAGHLELNNVSFGFNRLEPPLIEGFRLTIKPGERVALVGRSGSGKSTVARLVSGLYAPWSGEILLDGLPVSEYSREVISNSVAMVDQQIFMFTGTIRENLTLWDDFTPDSDVFRAAKDGCIHEDIAARAGGYHSKVEEAGANFSGGQRQRLEIARALANNPALLIMDEATSALDANTEMQVDANLRRRGCTCLIVAHRLSTIRDCDQILVLDHGKVVQRGNHEEMKDVNGPYAELIKEY